MERPSPERPRYPGGVLRLVVLALLAIVACQCFARRRLMQRHERCAKRDAQSEPTPGLRTFHRESSVAGTIATRQNGAILIQPLAA